jgi:hypothetical protein
MRSGLSSEMAREEVHERLEQSSQAIRPKTSRNRGGRIALLACALRLTIAGCGSSAMGQFGLPLEQGFESVGRAVVRLE